MDVDVNYCFFIADKHQAYDEESVSTPTSVDQISVEKQVQLENKQLDDKFLSIGQHFAGKFNEKFLLRRQSHIEYILRSMQCLDKNYMFMGAGKPWFAFWGMHSLQLFHYRLESNFFCKIIDFLKSCETPSGGYGGAPGQYAHLATTYAAVMALISIGTVDALASIDRVKLRAFLLASKRPNGSFSLHFSGEADIRGTYCAVASAFITEIADDVLFADTAAWIMRCQTYEGGFAGEPNCEAHGGYTYCALASLALLRKTHLLNAPKTLDWLSKRQMKFEGGFNGRTNKLVDGCYSFWQAASFFPLEYELATKKFFPSGLFDEKALQSYILVACQDRDSGGLRDKPGKPSDLYHTCYALSGLSIAQSYAKCSSDLIGGETNRLADVHPLYNVCVENATCAKQFFAINPVR